MKTENPIEVGTRIKKWNCKIETGQIKKFLIAEITGVRK